MTHSTKPSKDPDILSSAKALRRSAKRALEIGLQTGTPVYVMQKGNIIDLTKTSKPRPKRSDKPKD